MMLLALVGIQSSCTEALAPKRESNILAPKPTSFLLGAAEGDATRRQGLLQGRSQAANECLKKLVPPKAGRLEERKYAPILPHTEQDSREQKDSQPTRAHETSTWVTEHDFQYGNLPLTTDELVAKTRVLKPSMLEAMRSMRKLTPARYPNFVVYQLSVVYDDDTKSSQPLSTTMPAEPQVGIKRAGNERVSPPTTKTVRLRENAPRIRTGSGNYVHKVLSHLNSKFPCFISGKKVSGVSCEGWRDVFDDDTYKNMDPSLDQATRDQMKELDISRRFVDFLRRSGHTKTPTHAEHGHSEQALAALLYQDARKCDSLGPLSDEGTRCQLYQQALDQHWESQLCNIKLFILDIMSVHNTVCSDCDISLSGPLFVEEYGHALEIYCKLIEKPFSRPKVVIRTMADQRYSDYEHISCAGLKYSDLIPQVLEDDDPIMLHQVPPLGGHTIKETCRDVEATCDGFRAMPTL